MYDFLIERISEMGQSLIAMFISLAAFMLRAARALSAMFSPTVSAVFSVIRSAVVALQRATYGKSFTIQRLSMMLLFLLVCSLNLDAQTIDISSPESLFGSMEILYGAIIVIGGYLSAFIPGLREIDSGVYRVLAWALMTGIGFAVFGSSILSLAVTYAISTSLYEVIFKLLRPSLSPGDAG